MEVTSLEFQVQAYGFKFLSICCSDLGAYDYGFPGGVFLQKVIRARWRRMLVAI
jgi:glycyl-tRNA synthetase (class II)